MGFGVGACVEGVGGCLCGWMGGRAGRSLRGGGGVGAWVWVCVVGWVEAGIELSKAPIWY